MLMRANPYIAVLTCHPDKSSRWVQRIEARVVWTTGRSLELTFSLNGDLSRLRIPPPRDPRRADGLWQHTCFEVFIAEKRQQSYWEFNFSPSGEWAAYAFKSYRDGGPIADDRLGPEIRVRSAANSFELEACVRLDRLPLALTGTSLRLGLSAVIEENDGTLSYWALKHPPGKPDFHHPGSFALELALPDKRA
jgi:hypothetical protein